MNVRTFHLRWKDANGSSFHYPDYCTKRVLLSRIRRLLNKCPVKKTHAVEISITEKTS